MFQCPRVRFSAIKKYWRYKVEKKRKLEVQLAYARGYHKDRFLRKHFNAILVSFRRLLVNYSSPSDLDIGLGQGWANFSAQGPESQNFKF